jgi:hypothetical protein
MFTPYIPSVSACQVLSIVKKYVNSQENRIPRKQKKIEMLELRGGKKVMIICET